MKHLKQNYLQFSCRLAYMLLGSPFFQQLFCSCFFPPCDDYQNILVLVLLMACRLSELLVLHMRRKQCESYTLDFTCCFDWMQPLDFYIQPYLLLRSWAVRWAVADRQMHAAICMHFLCYLLSPCMPLS